MTKPFSSKRVAEQIQVSEPPQLRETTLIKLCFPIVAIEEARMKAAELGGGIAPKNQEWEASGFRACDGFDPEGNIFQVRESVV